LITLYVDYTIGNLPVDTVDYTIGNLPVDTFAYSICIYIFYIICKLITCWHACLQFLLTAKSQQALPFH
jgi:hypothetical protein